MATVCEWPDNLPAMLTLPPVATMRRAFATKDPSFDGLFVVAVKTTGVFCRPTCRAKPPRSENVQFFPTARDAAREGYRPCKLCDPTREVREAPAVVRLLMQWLDEHPGRRLSEDGLRRLGIEPSTARRQFRAYCGVTFAAYQRERSLARGLVALNGGASVIDAQLDAGFESASGFRSARARINGARRDEGRADVAVLTSTWMETPIGKMIAIAADEGIVLLDFADRKGLPRALARLKRAAGKGGSAAVIVPGRHPHLTRLHRELGEYFAGSRTAFTVPVVPRGTQFQRCAWDALRAIPFAETRSYAQQAAKLGQPRAVRAVARANGMNFIAIIIPCHRVIGADGRLTGYGGGLARKQWLLQHERRVRDERLRSGQPVARSRAATGAGNTAVTR